MPKRLNKEERYKHRKPGVNEIVDEGKATIYVAIISAALTGIGAITGHLWTQVERLTEIVTRRSVNDRVTEEVLANAKSMRDQVIELRIEFHKFKAANDARRENDSTK